MIKTLLTSLLSSLLGIAGISILTISSPVAIVFGASALGAGISGLVDSV
jgi:hypothetical protein